MKIRSRVLALTAVAALFATPVQADDTVNQLAGILEQARYSPTPVMTFLTGFHGVRNFRANQAQVRAALAQAGIPSGSVLDSVLRSSRSIRKSGRSVSLDRTRASVLPLANKGFIALGKKVRLDLTRGRQSGAFYFSKVQGIQVGEERRSLYRLKRLRFKNQRGRPVVDLTVKVGWFDVDRSFVLPPIRPAVPDPELTAAAPPEPVPLPRRNPLRDSRGAAGALDATLNH